MFDLILGSSGALVSKLPVTQKRLAVEQNGVNLVPGGSCHMYMDIFNFFVFRVILGSFSALVSKWPATQKWLSVAQKRGGIWAWG